MVIIICFVALGAFGAGLKYLEADAKREIAGRSAANNQFNNDAEQSWFNRVNPFLSNPPPPLTPQLSKEYLYAGSRLLTVEDANANAAPPADLAVWRPSSGTWLVLGGPGSQQTGAQWGQEFDIPVPNDYDGDGKLDVAVWRDATGYWYIRNSSTGALRQVQWGASSDIPVPAFYRR